MTDRPSASVGRETAERLEAGLAEELESFAEAAGALFPALGTETLSIAGGTALFLEAGSPVNQAVGLGFTGRVTEADLERLEEFYAWHRTPPTVVVSPMADPSLTQVLGSRGYRVTGYENVLVRALDDAAALSADPAFGVRPVEPSEREAYARILAEGFAPPGRAPTEVERRIASVVTHLRDVTPLLAFVGGEPAGTGELAVRQGMAWLTGDATLPRYRRRGVQRALQIARLCMAAEAGLGLAVSETRPGSPSQRNMERAGFRVAYTRVHFGLPPAPGRGPSV